MKEHIELLEVELESRECQIFDIREIDEWESGHLQGVFFQPLSELKKGRLTQKADMNKKTYLHCRSGKRVHIAKPLLEAMGFKKVIPLQEGFTELVALGFEAAIKNR